MFTNSYHGICFAIIFKKHFFPFSRVANNEKILTVLNTFGLQSRLGENLNEEKIDYERVYKILEFKKKEAIDFLNNAIEKDNK